MTAPKRPAKMPRRKVRADGSWYDETAARRAIEFFPRFLVHVKGPWKGRTFELEQWQRDRIVAPLFGWMRSHSIEHQDPRECDTLVCEYGRRVYDTVNLILSRGNAKTTLVAGILGYGTVADREPAAANYCMAGDLEQAEDTIFDTFAKMVKNSPSRAFRERLKVWPSSLRIVDEKTESFLEAIDSRAGGALGGIPHFSAMDEYLVQANTKLENAITTGMGKRRQPLFIRASTQGESESSPIGRLVVRIREIEAGVRPAPSNELNILCEATPTDDWRDERVWIRVNPGYGTSLQPSFVRKQIARAIDEPAERAAILQYGLNLLPDGIDAWMPLEKWDERAQESVVISEMAGRACIVAVSMPSATDIAAVAVVFLPTEDDDRYVLVNELYLPNELLRSRASVEHAPPLQDWVARGALHLTDGDELDYDAIEKVVLGKYGSDFDIREVVCNPRGSRQFMQRLIAEDANVVELIPSFKTHSPALNDLRGIIRAGRFAHDGNLAIRWMWTKAKTRKGTNEEIRLDRERSKANIEGPIAIASAIARAMAITEEAPSIYEERGLRTVG